MWKLSLVAACLFGITASAQVALSRPPRLQSGAPPALPAPAAAIGGGQVLMELSISPAGALTNVTPLRTTPPFTQLLQNAVRRWRFRPATATIRTDNREESTNVASRALVAAHFRAPTLLTPTLGEPPKDVASSSGEVPFPMSTTEPSYPPQARSGGVVMIEALVDDTGRVSRADVIRSQPPFDAPALDAARQWRFRPASAKRSAVGAYVYLIFGFPEPVVATRRP